MREAVNAYMIKPDPFIQFGTDHIVGMAISLLLWIWLPLLAKKHLSAKNQDTLGLLLGCLVMSNYLVWVILELIAGSFNIKLHLPFHLCRFANLAVPFLMLWKKERLFQILYYWTMSGMLQAAITPDATHGFPHFHYFRFFIGHQGMILVLIYFIIVFEVKPTLKGLKQSFIALNGFLLFATFINLIFDSNYFWISGKPPTASLLDYLGPWPWYILVAEFVALLHFFGAYAPFYYFYERKKNV